MMLVGSICGDVMTGIGVPDTGSWFSRWLPGVQILLSLVAGALDICNFQHDGGDPTW